MSKNVLELLVSADGMDLQDLTLRLFQTNVEQARARDPELGEVMLRCAVAPAFDAAIIGTLRSAVQDRETNQQLLDELKTFSFVQLHEDNSYVYHDVIRQVALAELEQHLALAELTALKDNLAKAYHGRGVKYYRVRNNDAALVEFTRAMAVSPAEQARYFLWRGRTYSRLLQHHKAVADFTQAIRLQPGEAENYFRRASSYIQLANFEAAVEDLNQAIAMRPNEFKNYFARGTAYYSLQNYSQALDDFDQSIRLWSNNHETYRSRGIILLEQDKYDRALKDFDRAIEINDRDHDNYFWRGVTFSQLNNRRAALADFTRSIEINPAFDLNYTWRGTIHKYLGNYPAALEDLNQAVRLNPGNENNYRLRGEVYFHLKRYAGTIVDCDYLIAQGARNYLDFYWRGLAQYHLRNYTAALADLKTAASMEPNSAINLWRGTIYYGLGLDQAALDEFNQSLELKPDNPDALRQRGATIYLNVRGDSAAALADFARALELNATSAQIYHWQAQALLEQGSYAEAITAADKAIGFDPQSVRDYFWRGLAYSLLQHTEQAQADWDMVEKLKDPGTDTHRAVHQAWLALINDESQQAEHFYTTALQSYERLDDLRFQADYLQRLARLLPQRQAVRQLADWFRQQLVAHVALGFPTPS